MAHSCPDCGQACYCGSDIDDCLFDDEEDSLACMHYLRRECDGYEDEDDCMDCGMCDSCIELTKAYFEAQAEAADGDSEITSAPRSDLPPTGREP